MEQCADAEEWTTALEKIPELADPRLEALGKDTLKHGAAYGYSPDTGVRHLVPGPLGTRLA
jgi:hypothetical protein